VRVKFLRGTQRGTGVPPVNPYGQDGRATFKKHVPQSEILPAQVGIFPALLAAFPSSDGDSFSDLKFNNFENNKKSTTPHPHKAGRSPHERATGIAWNELTVGLRASSALYVCLL